jgi:TetR/AcrR family transcriptional regulator, transcriptional repressor for nem operon
MPTNAEPAPAPSTRKGLATRARIVAAAAELMHQRGVAGTSTPAVRDAAGVSSSQIYHYFGDKDDLTGAVIAHHADAILTAQARLLAQVDDLDGLSRWRDVVVGSARQQGGPGGCPLGGLASELADDKPWARAALSASFDRWAGAIRGALTALIDNRTLRADTDAEKLAAALLAAVQGGLLLSQAQRTTQALEAGLDSVLDAVRSHAVADRRDGGADQAS